jgi:glycerophosphoryl diester phosphodiesterase
MKDINKKERAMKVPLLLLGLYFLLLLSCGSNSTDIDDDPKEESFAVEITVNNTAPVLFEAVSFAAQVSGGGKDVTVAWNFGDGFTASGIAVQHGFRTEGTHTISVIVTDGDKTANATHTLTVAGYSLSKALKNFDRSRTWLCAHRCNSGDVTLPENSIATLKNCIALRRTMGLDLVEIDPRMTKDGVMILMHDETVNRTTNGSGKVSDLTYAQIQRLRLKALDGSLTDECVPSLHDFLLAAKDNIWIDLDFINNVSHVALYDEVKTCGMLDQVYFASGSNSDAIRSLLSYSPPAIVLSNVSSESQVSSFKGMGAYVTSISATNVLNTNIAHIAANNGFAVMSHTLVMDGITFDTDMRYNNDYRGPDIFLDKGVNIIQSDYTPLLHTYLQSKNKR